MASKIDPNKEGFTQNDLKGFSNTATMLDYEPGSVIKPLTVASGLNQWFTKQTDEDGDRIGLDRSINPKSFPFYKKHRTLHNQEILI